MIARPFTTLSLKTIARCAFPAFMVAFIAGTAGAATPIHDCDRLLVLPYDRQRVVEKPPDVDPEIPKMMEVCERAVNAFPEEARFHFFYGFAAHAMARALRKGHATADVERLFRTAAQHFSVAAHKKYVVAQFALASLYENGEGVPKDYSLAARLYVVAAGNGYAPAYTAMGRFYALGRGVKRDLVKAIGAYRLAAFKGDPEGALEAAKLSAVVGNASSEGLVAAYMWALVAQAGLSDQPDRYLEAEAIRNLGQRKMTAAQIAKAEGLAETVVEIIRRQKAERAVPQPAPGR